MSLRSSSPTLPAASVSLDDTPLPRVRGIGPVARRPAPQEIPARRLVAFVDVAIVLSSFFLVFVGVNLDRMPDGIDAFLALRVTVKNLLVLSWLSVSATLILRWAGLYDAVRLRRQTEEVKRVFVAASAIAALALLVPLTSNSGGISHLSVVLFWGIVVVALTAARLVRATINREGRQRRLVLIVGTGPRSLRIYREITGDLLTPYTVAGFVDTTMEVESPFMARRLLGTLDQLESLLVREHVDEVFIGLPVRSHYHQIAETIQICERLGVKATYPADIFDTAFATTRMRGRDSAPRVHLHMVPHGARLVVKRLVDIAGSLAAIIVFSPVMLLVALAIRVSSQGRVVYVQERYGLNRRRFHMFKFRTMVPNADRLQASLEQMNEAAGPVFKIAKDPRVTPIGRFLRRTSLDELPQLFNVLRGDMSLVGPRPLPLRDVERFTRPGDMRRFSVRPGVTCLWQVNGRSGIGFDDWIKLDLRYIDQWSLGLDLLILARTVPAVLRGSGAH